MKAFVLFGAILIAAPVAVPRSAPLSSSTPSGSRTDQLNAKGVAGPGAFPEPWPLKQFVRWQYGWGAKTMNASGLQVRVEPKRCGQDRPASEGCWSGTPYLAVTVRGEGGPPVILEGSPGVATYIGVGRLTPRSKRPSLILISEDGGSGGCVQIDFATPEDTASHHVLLSLDPRDHGTICEVDPARLAWPRDITGHGRPEFLLADPIFSCRFTSCAGTWYPPRVVAFDGEHGVDVSADPFLAPLYLEDMAKARRACEQATNEAQGACAGYAADAARLGLLQQAWRVIQVQVKRGCRVPTSDVCPDINRIPADFPRELQSVLRSAGYD